MTRLYVALERELLVVERANGGWRARSGLTGHDVQCVAADPAEPARVYAGTFDAGLWRSDDTGETWRPAGPGIPHAAVMSVAVSGVARANGAGVVWAGTEPSAIYRSADGGETWQEEPALRALPSAPTWSFPPRPYTSHVRWIVPDPTDPARLLASIEAGGIMRSTDGGHTWIDRGPDTPYDAHTVRAHPRAPGRLYAAAGDGFMRPGQGYAESRDGGASWSRFGDGLRHHYLWGLAVDAGDPDTILVSGGPSPYQTHNPEAAETAIYRRAGGGGWEPVADGLPGGRGTLSPVLGAAPAEPGVFYLATNRGLFRSDDAGRRWQALPIDWPNRYQHHRANGLAVG